MNNLQNLNFDKLNGLVPAVVQDSDTGAVLMVGFMNREALDVTLETKKVTFWSRTKGRLWQKGETSGNFLTLISVTADCDNDALLIKARPTGPTCHNNTQSCFGDSPVSVLDELFGVIAERKRMMPAGSYTTSLFVGGLDAITAKVAEESEEVIRAAKSESKQRVVEESVDVLYHLFVLLVERGITFGEVLREIRRRRR